MAEVLVDLGENSYTIQIESGALAKFDHFLAPMPFSKKALIITDSNVKKIYGEQVRQKINSANYQAEFFCVPPGESSKSLALLGEIYTQAITMGLDRKSPFIALGGGVVGDLAGFAASTYLRGVPFIQIPTTLLAQVDSSVGGKTAVNHPLGKNLIGSFYQPAQVIIDPQTLNTLPDKELYSGFAEVIKYGACFDTAFFDFLAANAAALLQKDSTLLIEVISRCCRIKRDIVEQDEREAGLRALLNFGHTIGHAIEAAGGFQKYTHGEAVAIGMRGAVLVSIALKLCDEAVLGRLNAILRQFNLPLTAPGCGTAAELQQFLSKDKKSLGGKIKWVLLEETGKPKITDAVPESIAQEAINTLI
ncbi:MAG: 3-dehydroquinate synthase [Sporomusaceae bacterium]|nr:3-dehydroquinate synthase [Sporomusaceae bacterium]